MKPQNLRFAGMLLLVMVGAWAGARFYAVRRAAPAAATVKIPVGEASAPTASDLAATDAGPAAAAQIPDRMPEFSLSDTAGRPALSSAWRGRALVINFWATWCAPCRREIPLLETLSGEWAVRGVTVIGIAVDHRDAVRQFARELRITYPLLVGEQDALDLAAALGVTTPAFPFTVFTDRRGQLVALYLGEIHRAAADLILAEVQNLDQDREELAQARKNIAAGLQKLGQHAPG